MGYPRSEDARRNLWIALQRFFSVGLHRHRIASSESLRKRNDEIVRTILYWADLNDEAFVPVFADFVRGCGDFTITSHTAREYYLTRKTLMRGIGWFLRYQETGRSATCEIAGDYLRYAAKLAGRFRGDEFDRLSRMARWFIDELQREPSVHETT